MRYLFGKDHVWYHRSNDEFRWLLHWGKTVWRYEGYLLKNARHTGIGINIGGDENDFTFSLGIKNLFGFYFGVEDFFSRKLMSKLYPTERLYGISLFEKYISIEFHRDDYGFAKGWRGFHKMIDWKTLMFGKQEYQSNLIGTERGVVSMPEGDYPATIKIKEASWTRQRILKPLQVVRYEVTPDIPIPVPGKGESGYDIDDDALCSSVINANSLSEALKNVATSVKETRRKRAGKGWMPAGGFPIQKD